MLFVNENLTFLKTRINSLSQNLFVKMKLKQLNIGKLLKQGLKNFNYEDNLMYLFTCKIIQKNCKILKPTPGLNDNRMKNKQPILIILFCDLEMSGWRDKMRQKILLQRPVSWFIGSVFPFIIAIYSYQRISTILGQRTSINTV